MHIYISEKRKTALKAVRQTRRTIKKQRIMGNGKKNEKTDRSVHKCLECGKKIVYGRSDKKFCSPGCKNSWHNRRSHATDVLRKLTMTSLANNYRILSEMVSNKVSTRPMSVLMDGGFSPQFYTSVRVSDRHVENMCFDICYRMTGLKVFKVRKISPEEAGRRDRLSGKPDPLSDSGGRLSARDPLSGRSDRLPGRDPVSARQDPLPARGAKDNP